MDNQLHSEKRGGVGRVILKGVSYIAIILLVLLFAALIYLRNTWPYVSYAELLFHLKTSFDGTNPEMIYEPLIQYGIPAVIAIVAIILILKVIKKKNHLAYRITALVILLCLVLSNAANLYMFNKNTRVLTDFYNAVFRKSSSDFVEKLYVDPANVSMTFPEEKRNLIYIYLESMEISFADEANGGAFSDNYIPNLTKLAEEYDDFSGTDSTLDGGISLPGTNWTTGALFAQTSAIPLDLPVEEASITDAEQFFPTLTTMGDILLDAGYTSVVELGTEAGFGGQGAYYRKHGDYAVHDVAYAKEQGLIPQDYNEWWGYEDEKLFEFAKQDITELAKSSEPFNYTMFTMDTHCQDGFICRLCDDKYGDNQYANVIACSDKQVSEFIKWIQQQDFYENTTIVVTGDHPTMDADFLADIDGEYQRKTYTCIINSAVTPQLDTRREFATIDLFPTILAALGVQMDSDRLGCGTNLYGTRETIIEEYGKDVCWTEFSIGSDFVKNLIKFTVDEDTMAIAKNACYLEVAEEDGMTRFRLIKADNMSCLNITELTLVVHDNVTNEVHEYEMEREIARSGWKGIVHSDIPFSNVGNIDCEVYISVDEFDHYLLNKSSADELGMWDVRWDFE